MFVNDLKAAVISTLGTCHSIGLVVESKEPKELIEDVKAGKYDQEISQGNEEASQEKLDQLAKDFEKVKKVQDAFIKDLEKVAEEKAAAKAVTAAAKPEAGKTAAAPAAAAAAPAKKK
jgi:hypothetical protein